MKNKYLKLSILAVVVIFMFTLGLLKINKYYNIIENGYEYKISCGSIGNYYASVKNGRIAISLNPLDFNYKEKFPLVEEAIKKEIKKNEKYKSPKIFPFDVDIYKDISVTYSKDDNGFMVIDSVSADTNSPLVVSLNRCIFTKFDSETKKYLPIDEPYMSISLKNVSRYLYFSEKSMLILQKYIKSIKPKDQDVYAVIRVLGNDIVLVDVVLNGESLKEIANK